MHKKYNNILFTNIACCIINKQNNRFKKIFLKKMSLLEEAERQEESFDLDQSNAKNESDGIHKTL